MPNPENLIGHEFTSDQNREEAAKNGRKGGRASGKARRERKRMREVIDELMARKYVDASGSEIDGVTALMTRIYRQAMDGDMRAAIFLRDTVGEMPVQKVETVNISPEAYERVRKVLDGFENDEDNGVQPTEGD